MKILTVKTIDNKQMKRLLTVEANGKRKRNFWRLSLHEFNRYVETAPRETTLSKKKKKITSQMRTANITRQPHCAGSYSCNEK